MSDSNLVNAVTQQILRGRILTLSQEAAPIGGASIEVLTAALKQQGFSVGKQEITEACDYLSGKGLIRMDNVNNETLGISRSIAHITPEGIDALEGTQHIIGVIIGG
jgi:hypothetical protein